MIFISIKKLPNSLVNKIFCDTKDHIALLYIFETQITLTYIYLSSKITSSSTMVRRYVMLRFKEILSTFSKKKFPSDIFSNAMFDLITSGYQMCN